MILETADFRDVGATFRSRCFKTETGGFLLWLVAEVGIFLD